jgi:hypothetical protein
MRTRSTRGGFCFCCGRRDVGGYPRDGLLSLFYGSGYVGHQLFQIVLSGLNFRHLCVHFHLPFAALLRGKGSLAVFRAKVNSL